MEIVNQQIKNGESILEIFKNKNQAKSFNTRVMIRKLIEKNNKRVI